MPRACSLLGILLASGVIVAAEPAKPVTPEMARLLDKLGSDKMDERMEAARELGQLGAGARQAVPALRRLLADKNAWLRAGAAIALLKIDQEHCKEAMAALAGQFADERNGACILVLSEIGKVRVTSKDAVAGFLELAHHKHPLAVVVSWIVLDNLDAGAAEAAPLLEAALKDPLVPLRARAALDLVRIDRKYLGKALPTLQDALGDKDLDTRFHAAEALIEVKAGQETRVLDALTALFKDAEPSVRLRAAEHVVRLLPEQTPAAVPAMIDCVNSKDRKLQLAAAGMLAALGPAGVSAEPALRGHVKDADVSVALAAVEALMRLQPQKARELFPILVHNRDRNGKQRVADLLKVIDELYKLSRETGEENLKMLTEQLRQPAKKEYTDLLHVDAAIRLAELGPKAKLALGDLAKALDHASPLVRGQALLALARIGPEAKPALPRLTDFYHDRKQPADLRQGAARALQAIDPDTAKKLGAR